MLSHDKSDVLHVSRRLFQLYIEEGANFLNICCRLLPERVLNLVMDELALTRAVYLLVVRVLKLFYAMNDLLESTDIYVL